MFGQLTGKALQSLQEYLPAIQQRIQAQVPAFLKSQGLKGIRYVTETDRLRPLFETVYQSLPLPLRVLVRQDTFVNFCLSRKESLLENWLSPDEEKVADLPKSKSRKPGKAKPAGKDDGKLTEKVVVSKTRVVRKTTAEKGPEAKTPSGRTHRQKEKGLSPEGED